ncbi:uncharacterized protein LOC123009206 isoform X1 [Tribolium madens]|uniref:uncharacterized protein LOC123009206 isoform X1 n=1 Tax=Tribolium madens TaxID=41895 RepID=UPI001CF7268B|nr:uncharacterized protein LOC123009206 isoform X1 [Tribolium madens]XP_044261293.1 uncharacterized protein LOC123009206 isoform X1 [Tribolium madens]XP_044261294.1 uncharacterized protein LOC123009206 isoform X1 [Tribolium madens]
MYQKSSFLICIIYVYMTITLMNCYVITVKNKSHVYCISENVGSAIYVLPMRKKTNSPEIVNDEFNEKWNNEWMLKNSTTLPVGQITDKRWEDFPLNKMELNNTTKFDFSFYFSVYSNTEWIIRLTNDDDPISIDHRELDKDTWNHYSIVLNKNSTFIIKNNEIVNSGEFIATQITQKSKGKLFWRPHEYIFWWSNSTSQEPSTLEIKPKGKTCLLLYTSQCAECFLDVYINEKSYRIFQTWPEKNYVQFWQMDKIDIDLTTPIKISFLKKTFHQNVDGFWAMDIKFCSNSTEFYDTKKEGTENTICYELNNDIKTSFNLNYIRHTPGILTIGENTVHCTDVLGENFNKCDKHKICSASSECVCAWDFQGENCSDECGSWNCGLSCQESCPVCGLQCMTQLRGNYMNTSVPVPLVILMSIIVIINNNKNKYN